jgi:hypothetical protein
LRLLAATMTIKEMSQWPQRAAHQDARAGRPLTTALAASVAGGTAGWLLAFAGLRVWGLVLGGMVTLALLVVAARAGRVQGLGQLVTLGGAFVLLTWPVLWLVVGLVRYWITGDTLGA